MKLLELIVPQSETDNMQPLSRQLKTIVERLALSPPPISWEGMARDGCINALMESVVWDWWCLAALLAGTSAELRKVTLGCMSIPSVSIRAVDEQRGVIDIYIGGKHARYSEVWLRCTTGDITTRARLMTILKRRVEEQAGFELRPCVGVKPETPIYLKTVFEEMVRAEVDYRKRNHPCYATEIRVLKAAKSFSPEAAHIVLVKEDHGFYSWIGKTHKTSLEFVRETSDSTDTDGVMWYCAVSWITTQLLHYTMDWLQNRIPMENRTRERFCLQEALESHTECVLLGLVPVVMGVYMDETNANLDEMLDALNQISSRRGFYLNWWTK